jgi:hypothetical protein
MSFHTISLPLSIRVVIDIHIPAIAPLTPESGILFREKKPIQNNIGAGEQPIGPRFTRPACATGFRIVIMATREEDGGNLLGTRVRQIAGRGALQHENAKVSENFGIHQSPGATQTRRGILPKTRTDTSRQALVVPNGRYCGRLGQKRVHHITGGLHDSRYGT